MKRRGLVAVVASVIVGAGLQGLTASPGLGRMSTGWFVVVAAASLLVLIAQLVGVAWGLHTMVRARPVALRTLLWTATALAVAGLVAAVVFPPLVFIVVLLALVMLPAAAAGRRDPRAGFAVFRWAPWRTALLMIATVALVVVSAAVAVLAGFFLTGTVGGVTMWLWFGIAGTVVLWASTRLYARGG